MRVGGVAGPGAGAQITNLSLPPTMLCFAILYSALNSMMSLRRGMAAAAFVPAAMRRSLSRLTSADRACFSVASPVYADQEAGG